MSDEIVEANAIPHPPTGRSARDVSTGWSAPCPILPSGFDSPYDGPNGRRCLEEHASPTMSPFRFAYDLLGRGDIPMRCRNLLIALLLAVPPAAHAAGPTFVVNTTAEGHDAIAGDGKCETLPGNGVCTLRAAVEEANGQFDAVVTIPPGTIDL